MLRQDAATVRPGESYAPGFYSFKEPTMHEHEMPKKGDIFVCVICGMRIEVVKECACNADDKECLPSFKCCARPLSLEC